jgi:anti-repressor protein|nr:MAG TPA: repressor domain protein [Caudoviricetes sp.]
MSEIKVFENLEFGKVRVSVVDGEPLFCLADVAKSLGYSNPAKAVIDHCKGVTVLETPTQSGVQPIKYGKEGEVYRLTMKSKLPNAEKFQDWVCNEVLPSIRKHGAYMTDNVLEQAISNPDFMIGLLQNLKEEQKKRIEAEAKIELDKPKVLFSEAVTTSKTSILIGDLAKIIKQNGVEMGQNRMFSWLRDNGYLIKRKGSDFNMPTQKSMEMKLFEIKETAITHSDGHITINKTPKVTGAGQVFFVNKLLSRN